MSVQRWVAVVVAAAGVYGLAGWPWAVLLLAVVLALVPLPGVPGTTRGAVWPLAGGWAWVRRTGASWGRWASPQRVSLLAVPAGIVLAAAGLAMALGPGWGVTAAGLAVGSLGLALERRPEDRGGGA